MKKGVYLTVLILVFSIITVNAYEYNSSAGLEWLEKQLKTSNYNKPIQDLSTALIVLENKDIKEGITSLESKQTADNWNSNIKDTSFAILALNNFNKDTTSSIDWILKQQKIALTSGSWLVQINANANGTFKVRYNNGNNEKTFTMYGNKISECNDYFINVKSCLGSSIKNYDEFEIDCSNIGCNKISLIYKENENFYIINENDGSGTLIMQNSCLPVTSGSNSCDYESTLYATWILNSLNKDTGLYTKTYLEKNIDKNTNIKRVIHNALLYSITNDNNYLNFLKEIQNNLSGSFDNNVYATSIAILGIKSNPIAERAKDWLKTQQIKNPTAQHYGSWNNGNFLDTATALYSLQGSTGRVTNPSAYCGDLILDADEECDASYDDNGDLIDGDDESCPGKCTDTCECQTTANECTQNDGICCEACKTTGEHYSQYDTSCPSNRECCSLCQPLTGCTTDARCLVGEECVNNECVAVSECNTDSDCNTGEECTDNQCIPITVSGCTVDEDCAEGEVCNTETSECEKKAGFPWGYLLAFLIIVFLLMIGYIFYKKYKKPGKKEPDKKQSFDEFLKTKQQYKPYTPMEPKQYVPPLKKPRSEDDLIEKKLDESIRKTREILGKK